MGEQNQRNFRKLIRNMRRMHEAKQKEATRTRIHVGWRVVRMREGVREWLSHGGHWYPSLSLGETFAPKFDMEFLRDRAQHFGGRVVRVFLSYGRGR